MQVVLLFSVLVSAIAETAPREIPLDQVWAYKMPGTMKVQDLEPNVGVGLPNEQFIKRSKVQQVLQLLGHRNLPREGTQAGRALLVQGTDAIALSNAVDALSNKGKPEGPSARWFPSRTDLSLLFYSYMCPRYVHLVSVAQSETSTNDGQTETHVTVQYQFVSHRSANMSTHFALIPLGKLKSGVLRVNIEQLPPVDQNNMETTLFPNARRYVCESTTFGVK